MAGPATGTTPVPEPTTAPDPSTRPEGATVTNTETAPSAADASRASRPAPFRAEEVISREGSRFARRKPFVPSPNARNVLPCHS